MIHMVLSFLGHFMMFVQHRSLRRWPVSFMSHLTGMNWTIPLCYGNYWCLEHSALGIICSSESNGVHLRHCKIKSEKESSKAVSTLWHLMGQFMLFLFMCISQWPVKIKFFPSRRQERSPVLWHQLGANTGSLPFLPTHPSHGELAWRKV